MVSLMNRGKKLIQLWHRKNKKLWIIFPRILVLTLFASFLGNGCEWRRDVLDAINLPERSNIDKILVFSLDQEVKYNGIFESKGKTLEKTITKSKVIDDVYNFIENNYKTWTLKFDGMDGTPSYVVEFHKQNERVMMLWLDGLEISILTRPTTPKNIILTFNANKESVDELTGKIGLYREMGSPISNEK